MSIDSNAVACWRRRLAHPARLGASAGKVASLTGVADGMSTNFVASAGCATHVEAVCRQFNHLEVIAAEATLAEAAGRCRNKLKAFDTPSVHPILSRATSAWSIARHRRPTGSQRPWSKTLRFARTRVSRSRNCAVRSRSTVERIRQIIGTVSRGDSTCRPAFGLLQLGCWRL